jgi:tetratricopeptide (TPR) repeat protein
MRRQSLNLRPFLIFATLILAIIGGACAGKNDQPNAIVQAAENETAAPNAENAQIAAAQKFIEKMPDSPDGYNRLAVAYIQKARATGDFSLNSKAETAVSRALEIAPNDYMAQRLRATLHLVFHRFTDALELARKLQKETPRDSFVFGVLTDANIELGNYKEAVESAQAMMDLKPSMESYARAALLRSLYGDSAGAIEAMRTAAQIADPQNREAQAWCLSHLGEEYFKTGNFAEAEKQFDQALGLLPSYILALNGKAKTRAAQNDFEAAIKFYTDAQNRAPTVETVIALGDLYKLRGETEKAEAQYNLAEVIEQKFGNADQRRLALLWADRDVRLDEALTIATQEKNNRKDIYTADVYAWTLYKKGKFREAKAAIAEALNLKTKDARIFYHAGMIEHSLGNKQEAARYLDAALKTNPAFDILQAQTARKTLAELK